MDVCTGMVGADYQALNGTPGIKLVVAPGVSPALYMLTINLTMPPFDNLKVRQAISLSIDRAGVSQALTAGLGKPAYQFATTNSPAYVKSLDKLYAYNTKKATQLLKESGNSNGVSFTSLGTTTAASYLEWGELIQSQLKANGIEMNINLVGQGLVVPLAWGTGNGNHGNAQAAILAGGVAVTGIDQALRYQTLSTGINNMGGVEVPGASDLINKAAASSTFAQAAKYYQQVNKIVTDGVYVGVPVYSGPSITGYATYVGGKPQAMGDNPTDPDFLRGLYITKGKQPI
jgi:ABC-type transport system substrate-binding protein